MDQIEKKITKKTKAIMPVHWAGASPNMKKICNIAKKYKIKVIEDACQANFAKYLLNLALRMCEKTQKYTLQLD